MVIMDSYANSPKTRITGALMQNFLQKPVTLMGEVKKLESDGKRASFQTTDNVFVQIIFIEPIFGALHLNLLTELYGIVLSKNQLQCHRYKQFTEMVDKSVDSKELKFDSETYHEFVAQFVKHSDQHINCMVEEDGDQSVIIPTNNFSLPEEMDSTNHNMSFQ